MCVFLSVRACASALVSMCMAFMTLTTNVIFSCMQQLLTFRCNGIELTTFDAQAQALNYCAAGAGAGAAAIADGASMSFNKLPVNRIGIVLSISRLFR